MIGLWGAPSAVTVHIYFQTKRISSILRSKMCRDFSGIYARSYVYPDTLQLTSQQAGSCTAVRWSKGVTTMVWLGFASYVTAVDFMRRDYSGEERAGAP